MIKIELQALSHNICKGFPRTVIGAIGGVEVSVAKQTGMILMEKDGKYWSVSAGSLGQALLNALEKENINVNANNQ